MTQTAKERLGFRNERNSPHSSRTIMLDELTTLLEVVPIMDATHAEYRKAIIEDNALAKRSEQTRGLTCRHMTEIYGLDSKLTIFRGLRYLWTRDPASRPMLALLCAMTRDTILRNSAEPILALHERDELPRTTMEQWINDQEHGRFSPATLKSAAQNLNSSWTKSGHLTGKVRKFRSIPAQTAGAAAFALFIGFLDGGRGENLLTTPFAKILDCPSSKILELAESASLRGWITLKRVGNVIEVAFPNMLRPEELEWLRE
jgi:hypothetical protein